MQDHNMIKYGHEDFGYFIHDIYLHKGWQRWCIVGSIPREASFESDWDAGLYLSARVRWKTSCESVK